MQKPLKEVPLLNSIVVEKFNLSQGAKQVTVPKVASMNMSDLEDGFDIVDEEEIGMTTTDLTASEVGAKIIITDKLLRQQNDNVFTIGTTCTLGSQTNLVVTKH